MRKIHIQYNPYKLETVVKIDGEIPKKGSRLHVGEKRLQEWVDNLPAILDDECNSSEYHVTFQGTTEDYEDIEFALRHTSGIDAKFTYEPNLTNNVDGKEKEIDILFSAIQNGPIDDLKTDDIKDAFNKAKSGELEVSVVGTMSTGKSTLINAMLQNVLLPAAAESKTATVSYIRDNNKSTFRADAYGIDGKKLESSERLDFDTMKRWNDDEQGRFQVIRIEGPIPFVDAERDSALVLVDTPGPDTARTESHKEMQQNMLNNSSKTLVLYIMNANHIENTADATNLQFISDSMKVGGKASRDRFLFVVNKFDTFRPPNDDVGKSLENIRKYLKKFDIENPNIFPTAAYPALAMRQMADGCSDVYVSADANHAIGILNGSEMLHLEKYSTLPLSLKNEVNARLEEARNNGDATAEALIHTGIISLELAIRQYVQKYANTAKVKNIVNTFERRLEDAKSFATLGKEIAENRKMRDELGVRIATVQQKIDDGEEAEHFKEEMKKAVDQVKLESSNEAQKVIISFQKEMNKFTARFAGKELSVSEAEEAARELEEFAVGLEPKFRIDLQSVIDKVLKETGKKLIEQYREKVASLSEDIDLDGFKISINPLELLEGRIENIKVQAQVEEREELDGFEKNTNIKWYKPWTWWEEKERPVYRIVEFVDGSELISSYTLDAEKEIHGNRDDALEHAHSQADKIAEKFEGEFNKIDKVLQGFLSELEKLTRDKENAKKAISQTNERLSWLEDVQRRVNEILEI